MDDHVEGSTRGLYVGECDDLCGLDVDAMSSRREGNATGLEFNPG